MTTIEATPAGRAVRVGVMGLLALLAVGAGASMMLDRGAGLAEASTNTASVEPVSTETVPVTTVAATTPATAPTDSQPSTQPSSAPSITSEPDEGTGAITPITWIAVIATVALVAIAVWWMLSRPDDNAPPTNPRETDWPTRTDVI